jgi:RimJ/RimL family protein N-acetyltransferase
MIELRTTQESDIDFIEACLHNKDEDFAAQCGYGKRFFSCPVTSDQILKFQKETHPDSLFFTIIADGMPAGSFELMLKPDEKSCTIARVLIADAYRNKGCGTEALTQAKAYVFNTLKYDKFKLAAYDFNKPALRCYEKVGFRRTSDEIQSNGWISIKMEIDNPDGGTE